MALRLQDQFVSSFVAPDEINAIWPQVAAAHTLLHEGTGAGNDFLGWLRLPQDYDRDEFARIQARAEQIRRDTDIFIVIGIGGSYLGARAAIEFLESPLRNELPETTPKIYFSGNSLSGGALSDLLRLCEGKRVSLNVISKSGTTTEPAVAFRVFRDLLVERYGREEAAKRITCTTDRARGTLKELADREGYACFVIPDDVGGRYSVLTPVGLLPIAVAGADITALLRGAEAARVAYDAPTPDNACYRYAALRNILYRKGKTTELLAAFEPRFGMMAEWWKQLFGESEGKDHKGLFPASVIFSTDLHSMGQYIQEGRRALFETLVAINGAESGPVIAEDADNGDGLNFLCGKSLDYVNHRAMEGTILAHTDGGVPCILIEVPKPDAFELGYLIYFFEKACAISGYLLAVNPFNQPGVESYKKNMFALLGKPGYEAERGRLEARLQNQSL